VCAQFRISIKDHHRGDEPEVELVDTAHQLYPNPYGGIGLDQPL